MSALLRRQRDPEPIGRGWEIAFVAMAAVVCCLVCATLTGVGLAAAVWGGGWVWPPTAQDVGPVVVGVLHGQPRSGYPAPLAVRLAGPLPTYVLVVVTEATLLVAGLLSARVLHQRLGLGHRSGMATRAQAEQTLGVAALREARSVIRPDLTTG